MLFHNGKFFVRQSSRFLKNGIRHRNFTDVMERRRFFHIGNEVLCKNVFIISAFLKVLRNQPHILRSPLDMTAGTAVPVFYKICKTHNSFRIIFRKFLQRRVFVAEINSKNYNRNSYACNKNFRITHLKKHYGKKDKHVHNNTASFVPFNIFPPRAEKRNGKERI